MLLVGLIEGAGRILVTWLLAFAALAGVGLALRRALGLRDVTTDGWLNAFWLGFAVTLLGLQIWHLFLPIMGLATSLVLTCGVLGLFQCRSGIAAWLASLEVRRHWIAVSVTLVVVVWIANKATQAPLAYDTGAYHVPAVLWAKSHAIVPGLANLHGRLALNNASLLYAALFDVGPWRNGSSHLANSLLLAVLFLQTLLAISRLGIRTARPHPSAVFPALLLAPACLLALTDVSSLTTDFSVSVIGLAAAGLAYTWLVTRGPRGEEAFTMLTVIALLACAPTVKVSAAAFSAVALLVVGGVSVARHRGRLDRVTRTAALIGMLSVIGHVGAWGTRSVLLSGYPLFPSDAGPMPVEWRAPRELALALQAWIRHSARNFYSAEATNRPYEETAHMSWPWFRSWLAGLWQVAETGAPVSLAPWEIVLPSVLAVLGIFSFLLASLLGSRAPPVAMSGWLLIVPSTVAIAFWFLTAPSPRFGFFLFWILAATCLAQARLRVPSGVLAPASRAVVASVLMLGASPLLVPPVARWYSGRASLAESVRAILVVGPGPDGGLHATPEPDVGTYVTDSGLTLFVPRSDHLCWDAPLPCTPHPSRNLRLRVPGKLAAGFVTDGPWLMERWPAPWHAHFLESLRRYWESSDRAASP